MPILRAIRSIFLVETPFAHDSATALSAREWRSIIPSGEVGPGPQLGYAQGDVADGGGKAALAVAVARVRPVLAQHVRLRVHHLVHHRLEQGPGELPHVEEPVAVGWELL